MKYFRLSPNMFKNWEISNDMSQDISPSFPNLKFKMGASCYNVTEQDINIVVAKTMQKLTTSKNILTG